MLNPKWLVLAAVAATCLSAEGGQPMLTGVAEYSFDDSYRLIRTDQYMFRLRTDRLSQLDGRRLARVGTRVSVRLLPGMIERAWPMPRGFGEKATRGPASNCAK